MNICILTWLHNQNFGTLLQAYALQQFLKAEGHDVVDADYLPCVKEKLTELGDQPELLRFICWQST